MNYLQDWLKSLSFALWLWLIFIFCNFFCPSLTESLFLGTGFLSSLKAFEKPSGNRNWPFTLTPIQIGGIEPTFNFKKVLKIAKYCFWKGAFDNSLALDPKRACHVSLQICCHSWGTRSPSRLFVFQNKVVNSPTAQSRHM